MNLSSVDLNLLVAFDISIKEQNLSRTADELGLTQPAMSKRLSRLRSPTTQTTPQFINVKNQITILSILNS